MTTVSSLADTLATEAGEDFSDADVATQFQDWVREGYETIVSSARFLWQNSSEDVNTVASTAEYTLGATTAEVVAVQVTDSNEAVGYMPIDRLVALGYDLDSEAEPTHWYYTGINPSTTALKLAFYPVPDDVYAIKVYNLIRPPTLADGDTIPLPASFMNLVKQFVRAMVLLNLDQLQEYQAAIQRFDQLLTVQASRYNQTRRSASRLKVRQLHHVRQAPAASQD